MEICNKISVFIVLVVANWFYTHFDNFIVVLIQWMNEWKSFILVSVNVQGCKNRQWVFILTVRKAVIILGCPFLGIPGLLLLFFITLPCWFFLSNLHHRWPFTTIALKSPSSTNKPPIVTLQNLVDPPNERLQWASSTPRWDDEPHKTR